MLVLLSLFTEPAKVVINYNVLGSWAYLVIFGSLAGHGSYYWLVHRVGPLLPSTWTYISPVIAQFVGYYVLSEYLSGYSSGYSFIGLSLVLWGVFFVSRAATIDSHCLKLGMPGRKYASWNDYS